MPNCIKCNDSGKVYLEDPQTGKITSRECSCQSGLSDTSPMPFGTHRGLPMSDVPAQYLHFLWTEKGFENDKIGNVACYIRKNLGALKKEYTDGIW